MPASDQISDVLFKETITNAVQDVFKTMLGQEASLAANPEIITDTGESWERPLEIDGQHVVGTVGFIGELSGLIYLYMDVGFAREFARHLLGMTDTEIDEMGDEVINDAVGELTNMTVGTFKNQLCDRGFPCKLTIPSILRGSNFTIEPITSATRRIYRFEINHNVLIADLLMKQGD